MNKIHIHFTGADELENTLQELNAKIDDLANTLRKLRTIGIEVEAQLNRVSGEPIIKDQT